MKVAILAGGLGTRLMEETRHKPKALVEIGGRPVLWHIIRYYVASGFSEIVVALGYKGEQITAWFRDLDTEVEAQGPGWLRLRHAAGWSVDLVETGEDTNNGGRIKRLAPHLGDTTFMLTWCDGLADIDLGDLLAFHKNHGRLATLTAVHPPARFGRLDLIGDRISDFREKEIDPDEWVNGAFFVLEPAVLDRIEGDDTQFEHEPLRSLARDGELCAYRHETFWQCMDTLKEAQTLNALWEGGAAPWRLWERDDAGTGDGKSGLHRQYSGADAQVGGT